MQRYLLWCGYAGSSFEVKTETDSEDVMEYLLSISLNTSQVRTSTWRCEAIYLQWISKVFLYSKWIDTSSAGTLRPETVFVYNYLGCFWHTMKVLSSHLPMWTVPSCWHIWLVTCLYQCNDMKSYVLSACQVFYTINECKSHSLLHSEIRRFVVVYLLKVSGVNM